MDDAARRVEGRVLGGGLQRGLAGEAVAGGAVRQQTLLPEERLRQVTPFQLRQKVVGAPSEQLVPAAAQQDLVLGARRKVAAPLSPVSLSRSPKTWDLRACARGPGW